MLTNIFVNIKYFRYCIILKFRIVMSAPYECKFVGSSGNICGRPCQKPSGCHSHALRVPGTVVWRACKSGCGANTRSAGGLCTKCGRQQGVYIRAYRAKLKNGGVVRTTENKNSDTPEPSGSDSDEGFDVARVELLKQEMIHSEAEKKYSELVRVHQEARERARAALAAIDTGAALSNITNRIAEVSQVGYG